MILWVALFVLVLAISFILALLSMRDYQHVIEGDNSLFLIRNPQQLKELLTSSTNVVLERLFRGKETALVVFGPRETLAKYRLQLDLVELEDYTNCDKDQVVSWEVGVKEVSGGIFKDLPVLKDTEQFWWQLLIYQNPKNKGLFQTQIRAVFISEDSQRRKEISQKLQNISPNLFKIPKAFSNEQLLNSYKTRAFLQRSNNNLDLASILKLISV